MEAILTDLELDFVEVKYLTNNLLCRPDTLLIDITKRRIAQMQSHLNKLSQEIENLSAQDVIETVSISVNAVIPAEEEISPIDVAFQQNNNDTILAECLKPAMNLKKALTLNDTFRFSRELFSGNVERMEQILNQIEAMESLEHVEVLLETVLSLDTEEETDAFNDFMEIIKKHFA